MFYDEKQIGAYDGMDLRDYFAAAALPSIVTMEMTKPPDEGGLTNDQCAEWAYRIADAMLKARNV